MFTAFSGELGVAYTSIVIQTALASSIVLTWTGVTIVYVCNYEFKDMIPDKINCNTELVLDKMTMAYNGRKSI